MQIYRIDKWLKKAMIVLRRFFNRMQIRKEKKVFVIGFNKSASSSLHVLFESLGRPSYHGVKWRNHDDLKFLREYDCFSDGRPRDLSELDRLFPGSKFILNVRDLQGWVYSRLSHIERGKEQGKAAKRVYKPSTKWDTTEDAISSWIRERNNYHLFVLSYFSDRPDDLLIVNFVRDEFAATKVCEFLGYRGEYQRPQKNVNPSKERSPKHVEMLNTCLVALGIPDQELSYDIYCPSLEDKATQAQFPPDSNMLK